MTLVSSLASFLPLLSMTLLASHFYPRSAGTMALASLLPVLFLSRFSPRLRYYLRLTTFMTGLGMASAWGVLVSIVMSIAGKSKDINWVVARSFHGCVAPLVGMKFTVEGEEHLNTKPAVVIGNHQTMLDILYLGKVFPKGCSIMAKKELQWTPLLGQFMTLSQAVFVNRSRRADAVAIFSKVAATMKAKVLSLFIFVEGTRSASATPTLLPFKKGAFHLAVAAQLPIIPIICENYAAAYSAQNKTFEGGDVMIRVLAPISTVGLTSSSEDINALVERTRAQMLEALEELAKKREAINAKKVQ